MHEAPVGPTDLAEKLPDDGTLVPKHVAVGTWYELCFVIYCNVISAFCWFLNVTNLYRSLSYGRPIASIRERSPQNTFWCFLAIEELDHSRYLNSGLLHWK